MSKRPKPVSSKAKKSNQLQRSSRFFAKWSMAIFALLLVVAAFLLYSNLLKDYPVQSNKQLLVINQGDTYSALIERMDQDHIINMPVVLKLYQRVFIHESLKAGVYEVSRGMSIKQVLQMLSNADNAQMNRIMVIEGTTFAQLIAQLKRDPLVTHTLVDDSPEQILSKLEISYSRPEGLFAPNTYFFAKGETDQKILSDLYRHQMNILDRAWEARAKDLPYRSKYEALIMASIIEKETSLDSELTQVSGVFVRRLRIGMRLQTDPTVIYGMGERYQGKITRQDLRTPTPYNTYTIAGLPPGPIALPGAKAIEAAMHPDQSNNLYFVATGNGGHKFSENLQQHNRAVQEYLAVLRSNQ